MNIVKLVLMRDFPNDFETLGTLYVVDEYNILYKCHTLELPPNGNQVQISSIPTGTYKCSKLATTNIPYPHIAIHNVPNRAGICIHRGNYVSELKGCIAVGVGMADINNDSLVDLLHSKKAFLRLMELVPDNFELSIYA